MPKARLYREYSDDAPRSRKSREKNRTDEVHMNAPLFSFLHFKISSCLNFR